jgi:hypothetical protein
MRGRDGIRQKEQHGDPTQDALDDDRPEGGDAEPPQPAARIGNPDPGR